MAEQVMAVSTEEDGDEPKGRKALVLVLLVAVVGIAAGLYTLGMLPGVSATPDAEAQEEVSEAPTEGLVVEVAQLTAGIGGERGGYARVGFAAVLADGVAAVDVEGRFPLLKDAALTEISRTSLPSINTTEGMDALRQALTARAQEIYPDGEVMRMVLTELLVQ